MVVVVAAVVAVAWNSIDGSRVHAVAALAS